jgi:hypothetical protein
MGKIDYIGILWFEWKGMGAEGEGLNPGPLARVLALNSFCSIALENLKG